MQSYHGNARARRYFSRSRLCAAAIASIVDVLVSSSGMCVPTMPTESVSSGPAEAAHE